MLLAIAIALSLAACSGGNDSTANDVPEASKAKTEDAVQESDETTEAQETEAETTVSDTETEPAETEPEMSEQDMLVRELIAEKANDPYNDLGYCGNDVVLFYPNDFWPYLYNIKTGEHERLGSDSGSPAKCCVKDGVIYVKNDYDIFTYDLTGTLLSTISINDIAALIGRTEDCYANFTNMVVLEDGRIGISTHGSDGFFGILSADLKSFKEFPVLNIDIGHGTMYECNRGQILNVYGDTVYITYLNDKSWELLYALDLASWELSEVDEDDTVRDVLGYSQGEQNRHFAGRYYRDWCYSNRVIDSVAKESTTFRNMDEVYVTDKAFYYYENRNLYKYISEAEDGELIYEDSYIRGVWEDYLLVADDLGIFLVDRQTGEETKLEIE